MTAFASYARYYDLFYQDKAYDEETSFVASELKTVRGDIRHVLDLGCGTGVHALRLAEAGYRVQGVDMSAGMLELANRRRAAAAADVAGRLRFRQGNMRDLALGENFDAVVSLFHVMSYQIENEDLASAIATARRHLRPGSPFLFDFWHGPAVVASGPATRTREVEDETSRIVRVATPVWNKSRSLVEVHYHFTIDNKSDDSRLEFDEVHRMRYFFREELEEMLRTGGFLVSRCADWLTGARPTEASFSVYILAVAA